MVFWCSSTTLNEDNTLKHTSAPDLENKSVTILLQDTQALEGGTFTGEVSLCQRLHDIITKQVCVEVEV